MMKIAVTYENGQVFQHFGHTEQFKLYWIEGGSIQDSQVVSTEGSGHSALAGFLVDRKVDTLICGGIGGGAKTALKLANINLYPGVTGEADRAVKALLEGNLSFNPDTLCDHHGEGHSCGEHHHHGTNGHGHGHTCGDHCGK